MLDILRDLRAKYGFTQKQISDLMNVDQSTVSRIERGTIDSLVLTLSYIHALNELRGVKSYDVGASDESDVGSDKQS